MLSTSRATVQKSHGLMCLLRNISPFHVIRLVLRLLSSSWKLNLKASPSRYDLGLHLRGHGIHHSMEGRLVGGTVSRSQIASSSLALFEDRSG